MPLEEMQPFSDLIDAGLYEALRLERVVDRRTSAGGTATACVEAAIAKARDDLADEIRPGQEGVAS